MEPIDYEIIKTIQTKYGNEIPKLKLSIPEECDVLYNGPLGVLLAPRTVQAISKITKKTIWCASIPIDTLKHEFYKWDTNPYIWIGIDSKIYGFAVDTKTGRGIFIFQNSNKYLGLKYQQKLRQIPPINDVFEMIEEHVLKTPKTAYYYAISIIKERWERGEKVIFSDNQYASKYMRLIRRRSKILEEDIGHEQSYFIQAWIYTRAIRVWAKIRSWF